MKKELLSLIREHIQKDLTVFENSARTARMEATHEESKPENKYDTRGLEASYLAHGQAQRALELEKELNIVKLYEVRNFKNSDSIAIGALFKTTVHSENSPPHPITFFLVPFGSGLLLEINKQQIQVITPSSPLGQSFLGKVIGDTVEFKNKKQSYEYSIEEIS